MAYRFVTSHPALAPLFLAVGVGCLGAGWFGYHNLRNNPDVVTQRWTNPTPHNNVRQDQNIKLYSPNKDFWASRVGLPDPRTAFLQAEEAVLNTTGKAARKVKDVKDRAVKAVSDATHSSKSSSPTPPTPK